MADFCINCYEKEMKDSPEFLRKSPWEYELEFGICEGCGQAHDLVVGLNPGFIQKHKQRKAYSLKKKL